ncbi:hypothetical protein HFN76_36465 [Rhizobium laguerreae]|uniref:hypothetical protein n=1 Tax=Rhizobium laguerreae TaxID=1076926 RepID=UPI001C9155FC|nr:hypothetical protein [Rhizobium laguerreae]MBY3517492.1 hypothetical protein [Rhizobium laguerreae]
MSRSKKRDDYCEMCNLILTTTSDDLMWWTASASGIAMCQDVGYYGSVFGGLGLPFAVEVVAEDIDRGGIAKLWLLETPPAEESRLAF